jgi:hypothetical protein
VNTASETFFIAAIAALAAVTVVTAYTTPGPQLILVAVGAEEDEAQASAMKKAEKPGYWDANWQTQWHRDCDGRCKHHHVR